MAKKKDKVESLVAQLIRSELEGQLTKMVRKAKKQATRETEKLHETLRLEYHKKEGFVEAEYQEVKPEEDEDSELEASQGREKIDG
jgi:hypothetical protein